MLRNNKIENERQLGLLNFFWGGRGVDEKFLYQWDEMG